MVTRNFLISHAQKIKASSASIAVRELCDLIMLLDDGHSDTSDLRDEVSRLRQELSERDKLISDLEGNIRGRGRPPIYRSDEERRAHRREYMRAYRSRKRGASE